MSGTESTGRTGTEQAGAPAVVPRDRSLAAAALLRGRLAIARSFRLHRPRGAFCHQGWCQQCRIATPDGPRLACMLPADVARLPGPLDPLRPVGRMAEGRPPWFHEVVLPEPLRQPFLETLRGLSAAPRASPVPQPPRGRRREAACDVLVAGGGLAGLEAARVLAGLGADVLLCEAAHAGGRALLDADRTMDAGEARSRAERAGARIHEQALVAGLYEEPRRALVLDGDGPVVVTFERLVVATGSYDRLPAFAGNDTPGIIGVTGLMRLAAARAIPGHWLIGAAGSLPAIAQLRAIVAAYGLDIAWSRDEVPIAAAGGRQVRSVSFRDGASLACDLLVSGFRQPSYELQLQAGMTAGVMGSPPIVVPVGAARMPLLTVGSAAGSIGGAGAVAAVAEPWLKAGAHGMTTVHAITSAATTAPHPDAFVCLCEDVRVKDLDAAIGEGFDDIELLKRRTGAATGPCQGKLCHAEIAACLARHAKRVALPTQRPFTRPLPLALLAEASGGSRP